MPATLVAESQVVSAVLAAVNAALPATVRAYEPGKVPPNRPNEFVVVTVVRRSGGTPRAGRYSTTGWAVYVLSASKSAAANARNSLRLVRANVEGHVLTVGSARSTPVRFDNARQVEPDDDWFSGVDTYNFTV